MRILYLLPHFDEGINSFSKLLMPILEELERKGVSFEIYSGNRAYEGRFANVHKARLVKTSSLAFITFPINLLLGTFYSWLWRIKNPQGIIHNLGGGNSLYHDVITAHACHAQYLALKKRYKERHLVWLNPIHGMILVTEWLNYRRKTQVIAVSHFVEKGLLQHHPKLAGHIVTIENATPRQIKSRVRRENSCFTLLFASNNHHHKGLRYLLDAMELAINQKPNWKLLIAGTDPFEPYWRNEVSKRNLTSQVQFLGHRSDLSDLMAQSDLFALPSKYESFGMVFLEAAQVGCPSYGSYTGILETLYQPEHGPALCSHPIASSQLFNGLRYWAEHPQERLELGKKMQMISERFQAEAMVEETYKVYERVAFFLRTNNKKSFDS